MAESIHSIADCFNQIFLLIGSKRAEKKADELHSFGYGREEYFWGFMVAILLFFVGGGFSIYEGIHRFFYPEPIKNVLLSFVVLGVAIVIEFNSFRVAFNQFEKNHNKKHYKKIFAGKTTRISSIYKGIIALSDTNLLVILLEDFAAVLGLLVVAITTILSVTVSPIFDPIGSILVGTILVYISYLVANELRKLIVGESVSREVRSKIKHIISEYSIVKHINKIQTMYIGKEKFMVLASIDVQDDIHAYRIEDDIEQMKLDITKEFPKASVLYIEIKDSVRNQKI